MAVARAEMMLVGSAFLFAAPGVMGNSVYVAEKCQGGECADPNFPILDFDKDDGTCICRAHPCWSNGGVEHKCPDAEFPHLRFHHDESGHLQCECSNQAVMDSVHVSKDLCAGESCDSDEFPILDYDAKEGKCICRANPCTEDAQGVHHSCEEAEFPLLHFRIESQGPQCDCFMKLERPSSNLRGPRSQDAPQVAACKWKETPLRA